MNNFKLYLPSNASHVRFPNNTPSNYHTELTNPLSLEGKWEVALESLFYSSKIGNEKEEGKIRLHATVEEERFSNTLSKQPFKLDYTKPWPGYNGVQPSITDSDLVKNTLIDVLNSINSDILEQGKEPAFAFTIVKNKLTYESKMLHFYIGFTDKVMDYLNLKPHDLRSNYVHKQPATFSKIAKELRKEDFRVFYFNPNIVEKVERIYFSLEHQKDVTSLLIVLQRQWKERITQRYNTTMKVTENNTVVFEQEDANHAICFSWQFERLIKQRVPLFRKGCQSCATAVDFSAYNKLKAKETRVSYYVDIFNATLNKERVRVEERVEIYFKPREFDSVNDIVNSVNEKVHSLLSKRLSSTYSPSTHLFELSEDNRRVMLNIGSNLVVMFDENMSYILGFKDTVFEAGSHESTHMPATLQDHEQILYVETDVIEPILFGIKKLPLLREFIHDLNAKQAIIEKRFEPLSYIPIAKQFIPQIHIAIVNQRGVPISIKDTKTVATLHFRRVE